MDRNSSEFEAFMRVHDGLPRQGPGDPGQTMRALNALGSIAKHATIYDLGCGSGLTTLVLVRALKQKIVAVDLYEPFLLELETSAIREGLSDLVETRLSDMTDLGAAQESIDLIWAEGSIYCAGFDRALGLWHPLLKADGQVALTELSWLTDSPSCQTMQFWNKAYPQARSVFENILAAEALGYTCFDHFILPEAAFWDEYYQPILENIECLKDEALNQSFLAQAIKDAEAEIELYRQFSSEYGYVFYLLRKSNYIIERATQVDGSQIAQVFRESFSRALPTIPTLHTKEEDRQYFSNQVLADNDVFVVRDGRAKIVGFIAFDDQYINHLYILPGCLRQGLGLRLLNIAKAKSSSLKLWVFQVNQPARQFYEKHGFKIIKETDGSDNEEGVADFLFEWLAHSCQ